METSQAARLLRCDPPHHRKMTSQTQSGLLKIVVALPKVHNKHNHDKRHGWKGHWRGGWGWRKNDSIANRSRSPRGMHNSRTEEDVDLPSKPPLESPFPEPACVPHASALVLTWCSADWTTDETLPSDQGPICQ